jgi:hypothetical protein
MIEALRVGMWLTRCRLPGSRTSSTENPPEKVATTWPHIAMSRNRRAELCVGFKYKNQNAKEA